VALELRLQALEGVLVLRVHAGDEEVLRLDVPGDDRLRRPGGGHRERPVELVDDLARADERRQVEVAREAVAVGPCRVVVVDELLLQLEAPGGARDLPHVAFDDARLRVGDPADVAEVADPCPHLVGRLVDDGLCPSLLHEDSLATR